MHKLLVCFLFRFKPPLTPLLSSTRPLPVVQNNAFLPKEEFLYDHFVKGIAAEKLPNCFYLPNEFWWLIRRDYGEVELGKFQEAKSSFVASIISSLVVHLPPVANNTAHLESYSTSFSHSSPLPPLPPAAAPDEAPLRLHLRNVVLTNVRKF
jgi:hypothetical protein